MRLLNTTTLELKQFIEGGSQSALVSSERDVVYGSALPTYAILSHTWEEEEILFEDMVQENRRAVRFEKAGWGKIVKSCELAQGEGYDWIWIDTCCIDKTSSSELTEAINSMFQWYKLSSVCYVFLSDTSTQSRPDRMDEGGAHRPRWYTRGWTLQELIAPTNVQFYNKFWNLIGSREAHVEKISKLTGIEQYALRGGDLSRMSIARKMTWLSKRQTTRIEDMAYCMLGIFDVNMPMLYGEGQKVFVRLQEEIIRIVNDQSIFMAHDLQVARRREATVRLE